jgi:hypothetical protein
LVHAHRTINGCLAKCLDRACSEKNTCFPQLTGHHPFGYGASNGFGDLRSVTSGLIRRGWSIDGGKVWRRFLARRWAWRGVCIYGSTSRTAAVARWRTVQLCRRAVPDRSIEIASSRGSKSRFIFRVAGPSPRSPFLCDLRTPFSRLARRIFAAYGAEIRSCHN